MPLLCKSNLFKRLGIGQGAWFLHIALVLIAFCVCFNYTLLRNVKEALIVTVNEGAAVLPFIKVWAMLPAACLMTALFTFLAMRYRHEHIFQGIVAGFLLFFLFFLYILYPAQSLLYPAKLVSWLQNTLPIGAAGAIGMVAYWPLTLFYVVAELWGVIVLSVLFWGLASLLIPLKEAKWLYPLLNISGHCGCMLAGQVPAFLRATAPDQSLALLMGCILFSGLIMMCLLRYLYGGLNQEAYTFIPQTQTLLSIKESLLYVFRSKPLQAIATMVAGYSLLIYTTEIFWKNSLQQLYPDFRDYNIYVGRISSYVSLFSIPLALLLPYLLRTCGWRNIACIPPVLLSISSTLFCLSFLYVSAIAESAYFIIGSSAFDMLISFGSLHMTLALSCKYALFDPTKEMAFIPLDPKFKWTSKAAIDGVGSRLAQSTSSLLMQSAILMLGSLVACAPYLFPFLFVVLGLWLRAVHRLSAQFPALSQTDALKSPNI